MNKNINYNARILAANAMGASIQFLTQRSYLETLSHNEDLMEHLSARDQGEADEPENLDDGATSVEEVIGEVSSAKGVDGAIVIKNAEKALLG